MDNSVSKINILDYHKKLDIKIAKKINFKKYTNTIKNI